MPYGQLKTLQLPVHKPSVTTLKPGGEKPRPIPKRETCVSITGSLAEPLRNAKALVVGWEKGRPATSTSNGGWSKGLPTVHERQQEQNKILVDTGAKSASFLPLV